MVCDWTIWCSPICAPGMIFSLLSSWSGRRTERDTHIDSELLGESFASVRFERAACHSTQTQCQLSRQNKQAHCVSRESEPVGRLTSVGDADERVFLVERVVAGEDFHDGLGLRQDMLSLFEHAVLYDHRVVSVGGCERNARRTI